MSIVNYKWPRVAVVIPNWNGLLDTTECINSLGKITYSNYEIIVVDNGSSGNDAYVLEQKFSDSVHVIRNDRNYGFTGGCNRGIQQALKDADDYVLLLNNDTVVAPDFLEQMIKVAEADSSIGIAGAKIYSYGTERLQFVWGGFNYWFGQPTYTPTFVIEGFSKGPLDKGQYGKLKNVEWASGCSLLIKSDVIKKIGFLEESFFALLEEVEYCTRARKNNYRVVYVPKARVWHKWGKSAGVMSNFIVYHGTRNRFWLMQKYASLYQYCCFNVYFFGLYIWFAMLYYALFAGNPRLAKDLFRGIRDGLAGQKQYVDS